MLMDIFVYNSSFASICFKKQLYKTLIINYVDGHTMYKDVICDKNNINGS